MNDRGGNVCAFRGMDVRDEMSNLQPDPNIVFELEGDFKNLIVFG